MKILALIIAVAVALALSSCADVSGVTFGACYQDVCVSVKTASQGQPVPASPKQSRTVQPGAAPLP